MSDLLDFSPPGQVTFSLAGARARFFNAGTTTPRTVYADQAETVPHPVPLLADGNGRFPQAFVSGNPVKVVVTQADESTGYTLDPCEKVAASGAGAAQISFAPTGALPQTNVQAAIEAAAASAASGFTPFGLGITGNAPLLANIDATTIASGQYRFDGTTTGTYPTGVAAADTGAVGLVRETSGSAWQWLYHDTTDRLFIRRMNASTWGAWRENVTTNIGAAQGDLVFRNATNFARLPIGTAGQVLRVNAGATAPEWATPSSGAMTFATPQATTSGTQFDFGSIPANVSEVEIVIRGCSLSGAENLLVQFGTSGGFVTSGYDSWAQGEVSAGASTSVPSTAGFVVAFGSAAAVFTGTIRAVRSTANTWTATHTAGAAAATRSSVGYGDIVLGGALTQVRVTRTGSDTFDAGSVTVGYR